MLPTWDLKRIFQSRTQPAQATGFRNKAHATKRLLLRQVNLEPHRSLEDTTYQIIHSLRLTWKLPKGVCKRNQDFQRSPGSFHVRGEGTSRCPLTGAASVELGNGTCPALGCCKETPLQTVESLFVSLVQKTQLDFNQKVKV